MALPQQVQAALDAAEATLAATNGPPPSDAPPVEPALDAQPQPDPFAQAPQQQAAPVEPPTAAPQKDVWEERYKSLQGLFNQQVPDLQQKVKELQGNLNEAVNRLNRASETQERTPVAQSATDPKDIENFGSDLVEMVSRVATAAVGRAAQAFDAKVAQFEREIQQLKQSSEGVTQQVAMTAEQSFFDRVTKLVPSWEAVNADPAFLAWLADVDPVYGLTRQAALQQAQKVLNADHAAAVFKAFLGPKQVVAKGPDPLDKQVSPRGAATVPPTPADKRVLTQSQITEFYNDVRRGVYRGNEAEANRIEQLINAALSEGRVR